MKKGSRKGVNRGKVVPLPSAKKLIEYRTAQMWCEDRWGKSKYMHLIKSFVDGIKMLQADARSQGNNATIHDVVNFVQVGSLDELKTRETDVIDYTLDEWNKMWKAAAYEISKGTQFKDQKNQS